MEQKHTYTAYPLWEMMKNSDLDIRIKRRIQHLVNLGVVKIQAAKDNTTFVAYSGMVALTRKAVLFVKVNLNSGCDYAFEKQHVANYSDMLIKVVEILAKHGSALKQIA